MENTRDQIINRLFELAATSAITQGIITAVCLIGTFVLLFQGRDVPTVVYAFDSAVIGFFFGGKLGVVQGQMATTIRQIRRDN